MPIDEATALHILATIEAKLDRVICAVTGDLDGKPGLAHWAAEHQAWHDKRQAWFRGLASTAFSAIHPLLKSALLAIGGAGALYLTQLLAGGP